MGLTHYLFHSMPEVIWRKKLPSRSECPEFESLCPDFDRVLFNYGRISMRNAVQRACYQLELEEPGYEVFFCPSWLFVHTVTDYNFSLVSYSKALEYTKTGIHRASLYGNLTYVKS